MRWIAKGEIRPMSKVWIEELAAEIKGKDREAANAYGREQHRLGVVNARGREFFGRVAQTLEANFSEIKAQLQGDVTSSETSIESNGLDHVTMARSRFPWFDAVLRYEQSTIVLDYAQGKGVAGDPKSVAERQVTVFSFAVTGEDRLLVEEGFGEQPKRFAEPEDLARHIMEILFAA
jgi:hypothetical protein